MPAWFSASSFFFLVVSPLREARSPRLRVGGAGEGGAKWRFAVTLSPGLKGELWSDGTHSKPTPQSAHLILQCPHSKGPLTGVDPGPVFEASLGLSFPVLRRELWHGPSPSPHLRGVLPGRVTSALPLADQTGPDALAAAFPEDLWGSHRRSRHRRVLATRAQARSRGGRWEL